jgi:putative RecB family exonuclease
MTIHTSPTALEQYDRCALQYHIEHDIKKKQPPTPELLLGRAIHEAIELLFRDHLAEDISRPLDLRLSHQLFEQCWQQHQCVGQQEFVEGLQMISDLCEKQGDVDPSTVHALEHKIEVTIEDVVVHGYIDRVDLFEDVDETTGEVFVSLRACDYKTTRQWLTTRDVEDSIQCACYALALPSIEPTASRHYSGLYLLRTGEQILARYSDADMRSWTRYLLSLAHRLDEDREWKPRLNQTCVYCGAKDECPEYARALKGERILVAKDMNDFDGVAREREDVSDILRILEKRKEELTQVIKAFLESSGQGTEMGDSYYRLSRRSVDRYPLRETVRLLTEKTGHHETDVMAAIGTVSNSKLESLLKDIARENGVGEAGMIRAHLANIAERSYTTSLYHRKKGRREP